MKIWLILPILLFALLSPAKAHGGEDHGDIRAGQKTASPAGPTLKVDLRFQSQGKTYIAQLVQLPERPFPGQEIQLEFVLKQQLDPPDPLLGGDITVEGAEFEVKTKDGAPLGKTHAEAGPGTYSFHWTPSRAGQSTLLFTGPNGLSFDYNLTIAWPMRQKLATAAALGLLLLPLLWGLVRRRFFAVGWILSAGAAGLALGVGFWPAPPPAPVESAIPKQAGLHIPEELFRDLDLKMAEVRRQRLRRSLDVPGQLQVPEGSRHALHPRFTSRLLTPVPRVGERVFAGQELAVLEEVLNSADRAALRSQSVELKSRQLEFATRQTELKRQIVELQTRQQIATSALRQSQLDLTRAEQLYAISVIPLKELQASRTALLQAQQEMAGVAREVKVLRAAPQPPELPPAVPLQQYALVSPVQGVIAKVDAAQEEVVESSKSLFEVVDLSTIWVSARVSEADIGAVRAYGRAMVKVPAYSDGFPARFVSLAPSLDAETRTAQVYFSIDNRDGRLLDGMSAQVQMQGGEESVIVVPSQAVLNQEGELRVFVQVEEDLFEPRTLRVSRQLEGQMVVQEGLQPGDKVVVGGVGALASELARRGKSHD